MQAVSRLGMRLGAPARFPRPFNPTLHRPYNSLVRRAKSLYEAYDGLLQRHRLATTTATGTILAFAGDLCTQTATQQNGLDDFDMHRGLSFALFGGAVTGPVNYFWLNKVCARAHLLMGTHGSPRAPLLMGTCRSPRAAVCSRHRFVNHGAAGYARPSHRTSGRVGGGGLQADNTDVLLPAARVRASLLLLLSGLPRLVARQCAGARARRVREDRPELVGVLDANLRVCLDPSSLHPITL